MSQPTRHPADDLLLDYGRGVLEPGRSLVLNAHLGVCRACRAVVRAVEAVGGVLLQDLPPSEMAADALDRALTKLEVGTAAPAARPPQPSDWIRIPGEVVDAARRGRRWAAPGVWVANVTGDARRGPRSYLLRVAAGMAVPRHTHDGGEFTCVLKGAFEDRGVVYGPGDFVACDEGVEHRPRVTSDGECVCLIAADSPLVPRDLIGRIFQPFVGI